jgi:hypothetical protein
VYDCGVFEGLEREIEALEAVADEAELAKLISLWDRLGAHIAERVHEVDAAELWRGDGSPSMTSWLKRTCGMTGTRAHQTVRTGRIVGRCPAVREAWRSGRVGSGQVEVIASNLVLLCWHHHHLSHQRGWELKLLPSATVEVTRPDGQVMTSDPRPPRRRRCGPAERDRHG